MKPRTKKPSKVDEPSRQSEGHSYETFLRDQQNWDVEWAANREASRVKKASSDEISALKQQLEAKDRECALLKDQLHGHERLCKVSTNISNLINKQVTLNFNSSRVRFPESFNSMYRTIKISKTHPVLCFLFYGR